MKSFTWKLREFGLKTTIDEMLISLLKWYLGAKRITISYPKNKK